MPPPSPSRVQTVALIGNPNTGKSTLFNALVGVHQRVGNYPGVTVEKRTGRLTHGSGSVEVIDLPGTYSLAPRSRDELVAVELLLGRLADTAPVDAVLCVVDASNLERNLYLVSQVLDLEIPTVVAVNMVDLAEREGAVIDFLALEERLGVPVVPVQAHRKIGIGVLKDTLANTTTSPSITGPSGPSPSSATPSAPPEVLEVSESRIGGPSRSAPSRAVFPNAFETETKRLAVRAANGGGAPLPGWAVRRLLLDADGLLEADLIAAENGRLHEALRAARSRLAEASCPLPEVETTVRYTWARGVLDGVVTRAGERPTSLTDHIDRVLTHPLKGLTVFAMVMFVVFQSIFAGAVPAMEAIEAAAGGLGAWLEGSMAAGPFRSLLVDGVIAGVGGVLVFLPQILILFFFIALLEDCGYMARGAFLMDRFMVRVGLSGKSFIPMLSSFACAIPGVMAARTIENERDRLTTILVAPLLTCSARLPVYALLIAAFVPAHGYLGGWVGLQGLTLAGLYLLGIAAAVAAALVFKRTLFRGRTPAFLMELPSYKWPSPRTVFFRVAERGWVFIRCAGTLILAVSILVWAALYFPRSEAVEAEYAPQAAALEAALADHAAEDPRHAELAEQLTEVNRQWQAAHQRQSILGRMGRLIEPAVEPLGWDWRIGCAAIASFPAREVVVATLGVIFAVGEDVEDEEGATQLSAQLKAATWEGDSRPLFTLPTALSILVFFALCAQCAATLAVIRRETNSWRWPAFTFAYMTALAYLGALATYQIGSLLT